MPSRAKPDPVAHTVSASTQAPARKRDVTLWAKELTRASRVQVTARRDSTLIDCDGRRVTIASALRGLSWPLVARALLELGPSCVERHEEEQSPH